MGVLAGVTDCKKSRKWACRGRWALGFKPRHSSHRRGGPRGSDGGKGRGPRGFGVLLFATWLRQQESLCWEGRKGEKGLLLVGHEKVPHGFGLTGDCSSHTADDAGSLNHGLLLSFLRHGTPDWAEGEGRTVCICGYSKGL